MAVLALVFPRRNSFDEGHDIFRLAVGNAQ
jgi:hypothetical protein